MKADFIDYLDYLIKNIMIENFENFYEGDYIKIKFLVNNHLYKRKVYHNGKDGLYFKFKGYKIFKSDFY